MARVTTSGWLGESFDHDRTDWGAAAWSGVIAGIVFMLLEMLMVMLFMGQSPWAPPRMIAAMALGHDALPPPASFDLGIMMTAMMIHFAISIVYGLGIGAILHRLRGSSALLVGAILGLAIYLINFYLIAPAAFPWFTKAHNWVTVTTHLIFGLVLAGSYAGLRVHKPMARR